MLTIASGALLIAAAFLMPTDGSFVLAFALGFAVTGAGLAARFTRPGQ